MRNIEIKAKIKDLDFVNQKLRELNLQDPVLINQEDTFFKVPKGRLKLRKFEDNTGELIYYERPDTEGPKMSYYEKTTVTSAAFIDLTVVLTRALGIFGQVKKRRLLYILDQTRIHIDLVQDLGLFLELEVVLRPDQSIEDGHRIAETIMKIFEIRADDLIPTAYVDILNQNQ